jgi:NTP pyrophosphatase (non-canonical NTP hydrolase)
MSSVDLKLYEQFVDGVTSKCSNNIDELIYRLRELSTQDPKMNVSLLLTAGIGLASEAGEFDEIVKKMVFQGKPWNEDTKFHLFRELGDIAWYWVNACRAIGVDPNAVIEENVRKLESRYPGGQFSVTHSENRKAGDL